MANYSMPLSGDVSVMCFAIMWVLLWSWAYSDGDGVAAASVVVRVLA